jgi:rare lipoprotein A (peptidoglycan hydrolase)
MPADSNALFLNLFVQQASASPDSSSSRQVDARGRAHSSRLWFAIAARSAIAILIISSASLMAGCGQVWSDLGLHSMYRTRASHHARQPTQADAETIPSTEVVKASWYGGKFSGRHTASGERFDPNRMTAASKTLPIGSVVRVTNPETGRSVNVRINDRGPYVRGRSLDLSRGAARKIGLKGVAHVKVTPVPTRSDIETASMLE